MSPRARSVVSFVARAAIVLASVVLMAACSGGAAGESGQGSQASISGLIIEHPVGRSHRQGRIDYQGAKPPSGGDHNPVWLNCGAYSQQPPDEFAVHSLEHGAVWIAYGPELSASDVATLRQFAAHDHVIVSPYAGLDAPIVLVAWGRRLDVQQANDGRIAEFVDQFAGGPQAPERGGVCRGGTGQPEAP